MGNSRRFSLAAMTHEKWSLLNEDFFQVKTIEYMQRCVLKDCKDHLMWLVWIMEGWAGKWRIVNALFSMSPSRILSLHISMFGYQHVVQKLFMHEAEDLYCEHLWRSQCKFSSDKLVRKLISMQWEAQGNCWISCVGQICWRECLPTLGWRH